MKAQMVRVDNRRRDRKLYAESFELDRDGREAAARCGLPGHRDRKLAACEEICRLAGGRGQVGLGQNRQQPLCRQGIEARLELSVMPTDQEIEDICWLA